MRAPELCPTRHAASLHLPWRQVVPCRRLGRRRPRDRRRRGRVSLSDCGAAWHARPCRPRAMQRGAWASAGLVQCAVNCSNPAEPCRSSTLHHTLCRPAGSSSARGCPRTCWRASGTWPTRLGARPAACSIGAALCAAHDACSSLYPHPCRAPEVPPAAPFLVPRPPGRGTWTAAPSTSRWTSSPSRSRWVPCLVEGGGAL